MLEFLNSPLGIVLGFLAGALPVLIVFGWLAWWLNRRDRRRMEQRSDAHRREMELQHQLWDMQDQIREENLPEDEREWRRQYRQREAEVKREARRRLGLPEEKPQR
jgi:hypothetical protein